MRTVHPTSSYRIDLPDDFVTDDDPRVPGFWRPNDPLLLQLSNYVRVDGEQLDAQTCLEEWMAEQSSPWRPINVNLNSNSSAELATGEHSDTEGNSWVHAILVWPHLLIYVTLIASGGFDWHTDNWGFAAIRTITPMVH